MVQISKNIEMAQGIHEWLYGVVFWLEHMTTELLHAKLKINKLMENLRKHNTVKWKIDELQDEMAALRDQWTIDTWDLQLDILIRQMLL